MSKILVIDDEYPNRYMMKIMLKSHDLKLLGDTKNLVKELEEFEPDLILLDIMMPGKSGFDIAKELGKNRKFSKIPIIFVTAKEAPEFEEEGFSLGAYDYIIKPVVESVLKARINSVLSRSKRTNVLFEGSMIDELTNVYNRKHFIEEFEKVSLTNNGTICSLAVIDIDQFKSINDSYGHLMGDYILEEFAKLLKLTVREEDIVGRYGGDEFVVFLQNSDKYTAKIQLTRLKEVVDDFVFQKESQVVVVTFSCGISDFADFGSNVQMDFNVLFEVADKCLYNAKKLGRNQIVLEHL